MHVVRIRVTYDAEMDRRNFQRTPVAANRRRQSLVMLEQRPGPPAISLTLRSLYQGTKGGNFPNNCVRTEAIAIPSQQIVRATTCRGGGRRELSSCNIPCVKLARTVISFRRVCTRWGMSRDIKPCAYVHTKRVCTHLCVCVSAETLEVVGRLSNASKTMCARQRKSNTFVCARVRI